MTEAARPSRSADGISEEEFLTLPTPADFHWALPTNWFTLDPTPGRAEASVARVVRARIRRYPQLAAYREQLTTLLHDQLRAATRHGVREVAMMAEVLDEHTVSAALCVFTVPAIVDDGATAQQPTVLQLTHDLAGNPPSDQLEHTRNVSTVDLPQQPAARLSAVQRLSDDHGVETDTAIVQYFVPMPSSTDMVVLAFSTPTLHLADPLTELFDTIAGSFYFTWAD